MKHPINKFLTELAVNKPANLILLSIGNPSPKYDATRHSAGHLALDYVTNHLGGLASDSKYWDAAIEMSPLSEHPHIYIAKSQEYMNLSGKAVRAAIKKFPAQSYRLVVFHDDIDTDAGDCKFKLESRQIGGHGGLKDIAAKIPDPFARLRIGIGEPHSRTLGDVAGYVLKKMTLKERELLHSQTLPKALNMVLEMAKVMDRNARSNRD